MLPAFPFKFQTHFKVKKTQKILYFVKSGKVRDEHKKAASAIEFENRNFNVVFRNSTVEDQTSDFPEKADGVAGKVPAKYQGYAVYDDDGELTKAESTKPKELEAASEVNELGLPKGSPSNREELVEALQSRDIKFHARANVEKLTDLYRANFLTEDGGEV